MEPPQRRQPIAVTLPPHGVFVLESHHAPGFRMGEECHDFLEIFYVLEGAGVFTIGSRPHPCRRGDLVVVPMGIDHRIDDDPASPLALYGICVAPRVWGHEPSLLQHLPAGRLSMGKAVKAQVRFDLRRLLFEQTRDRPGSRTLVLGLTLELLAMLAQNSHPGASGRPAVDSSLSNHRQAVQRYVASLPHRFFEATDLDQAAAEHGMSRRRFTQLFRQLAGTSWSVFVTSLRMDYACKLLRETSRSIMAIAFECGYEDLSSFYRAFKRRTGLPPKAWREQACDT